MSKKNTNASGDQFVLSYDLLKLMRWVVENHDEEFKHFIASVLAKENMVKANATTIMQDQEEAQNAIVEFLSLMEVLVLELKNEYSVTSILQKQLMPAVDHIDMTGIDASIVASSIEDATEQFHQNPKKNPQELLYKELLRQWKPTKKAIQN